MKLLKNILMIYICFHLFGSDVVSHILKFQDAYSSVSLEEEDDEEKTKEEKDSKEEKYNNESFEFFTAITFISSAGVFDFDNDKKVNNYSFEVMTPPPNC